MRYAVVFLYLLTCAQGNPTPEDLLPMRTWAYTQPEIERALNPYLMESVKPFYRQGLGFIFSMGEPKHPNQTVIKGWQCLLEKVMNADQDLEEQRIPLLDLLALHKSRLAGDLLGQVQDHAPCANCVASARHAYVSQ